MEHKDYLIPIEVAISKATIALLKERLAIYSSKTWKFGCLVTSFFYFVKFIILLGFTSSAKQALSLSHQYYVRIRNAEIDIAGAIVKHQDIIKNFKRKNIISYPEYNTNISDTDKKLPYKAITILDRFSSDCISPEINCHPIKKNFEFGEIENIKPDLLFVESAWHGNNGEWHKSFTDFNEEGESIRKLLKYCKDKKIPTVFWNKEDPPNYNLFKHAASQFDFIFTTDENCIPSYVKDADHNRVFSLPFACQPQIHFPNPSIKRAHDICFAGTWYGEKHPERKQQFQILFDKILDQDVHIFDRKYNFFQNGNYVFPYPYSTKVVGGLNYSEMLTAYRAYKIFLNVNSVFDSPTMFSRRVFELLACGTPVISTYARGIELLLPGMVQMVSSPEECRIKCLDLLENPSKWDKISREASEFVIANHTYKNRLEFVLERVLNHGS